MCWMSVVALCRAAVVVIAAWCLSDGLYAFAAVVGDVRGGIGVEAFVLSVPGWWCRHGPDCSRPVVLTHLVDGLDVGWPGVTRFALV